MDNDPDDNMVDFDMEIKQNVNTRVENKNEFQYEKQRELDTLDLRQKKRIECMQKTMSKNESQRRSAN